MKMKMKRKEKEKEKENGKKGVKAQMLNEPTVLY